MAKKINALDIIKKFDNSTEVIENSSMAVIKDYIPTGSYILNACLTGSILKGAPTGRTITLAGIQGSGKTFVALSICREAQKKGFVPIYLDSENAVDIEFARRLGIDTSKFLLKHVNVITEVSNFLANLVIELDKFKEGDEDKPKYVIVLDSLGNLTSSKEKEEMEKSDAPKRDMTKQQEIKAMFRVNTVGLARHDILFIVASHVYSCVEPDTQIIMENGELKEIQYVEVGEKVLTKDGAKEVLSTHTYPETLAHYELEFEDGLKIKCTPNHRFLVDVDGKEEWITAEDLTPEHKIITHEK